MISLPSKPWKRLSVEGIGQGKYLLQVLSPLPDEGAFNAFLEEELSECLGEGDVLEAPNWEGRSVVLVSGDLDGFRRRCAFMAIRVERKAPPSKR